MLYDSIDLYTVMVWRFCCNSIFYHKITQEQIYLRNKKHENDNALSFYGSKMILDFPNNFDWVSIVLDGSNLFWSGPNHFWQVQIIKIAPEV